VTELDSNGQSIEGRKLHRKLRILRIYAVRKGNRIIGPFVEYEQVNSIEISIEKPCGEKKTRA